MLRINVTVEESTHDKSLIRMRNVVVVLNDDTLEQIANEVAAQQSVQPTVATVAPPEVESTTRNSG